MKFAICDDDPKDLETIQKFLLRFDPFAEYTVFSSANQLLEAYKSDYFDIVLLDIEMRGIDGFQAAQALNKLSKIPFIIFITYSGAYTIQGYEVAYRYLMKPLEYDKFIQAISSAMRKAAQKNILIQKKSETIILSIQDIMYIDIFNYLIIFHTRDGAYEERMTLKKLEKDLKGNDFVRPHNSYLVNMKFINYIHDNYIVLMNEAKIPISRNRRKAFDAALIDFLRG